jgi:hypothetical protein
MHKIHVIGVTREVATVPGCSITCALCTSMQLCYNGDLLNSRRTATLCSSRALACGLEMVRCKTSCIVLLQYTAGSCNVLLYLAVAALVTGADV